MQIIYIYIEHWSNWCHTLPDALSHLPPAYVAYEVLAYVAYVPKERA